MPARPTALSFGERFDADGKSVVVERLTCVHCQNIFDRPRGSEGESGWCQLCFKEICLACGALDRCDPFEKKLDRMAARARLLAAVGGG